MDEDPDYTDYPYPCPHHPEEMVTGECMDPWAAEMWEDLTVMIPNCPMCVQERQDSI